jgi:16S rRNA (cytosine1402-N4)-methyltransferase
VLPEPEPSETNPGPDAAPRAGAVHRSVLLHEVVAWLAPVEGAVIVDGTAGAGGHTRALAEKVGASGRVIGLDRDPAMLELARSATTGLPVTLIASAYSDVLEVLEDLEIAPGTVDGLVLDLGLSSDQLAWTARGFSFAVDGPLDMRFDPGSDDPSAADLVNSLGEEQLATIFYEYGEERHSRRVARRIVEARRITPFTTTCQLADVVRRSIPGKWGPIDPATRSFQALRIAVNHELTHLENTLTLLPDVLRPGGRAAIISFHSLEDRRVKHAFRDDPRLLVLTRKPVTATPEELASNPRARSAKLRVAERCPTQTGLTETTSPTRKAKGIDTHMPKNTRKSKGTR